MWALLLFTPVAWSQTAANQPTPEDRIIEIQDVSGDVRVKFSSESEWEIARKGMQIKQDGEIKTSKESLATILLDKQGATGKVDIKPDTWMRIAELDYDKTSKDKKTILDLALGQVLVQAQKLHGEDVFQVRTPTSTTSVRGTVFEVKVEEK